MADTPAVLRIRDLQIPARILDHRRIPLKSGSTAFVCAEQILNQETGLGRHALVRIDIDSVSQKTPFRAEIGANSWHSGRDVGAIPAATEAPDGLRTENGGKSARMSCFQGQ